VVSVLSGSDFNAVITFEKLFNLFRLNINFSRAVGYGT